jgi:hypothetical protein
MKALIMNFKINSMFLQLLWIGLISVPIIADAQTSPAISHFTISDIGSPTPFKPGQVTVGENIESIAITARDASGKRVTDFNGPVYLSEYTEYGIGRISPEVVQLVNGEWKGKLIVFRAGEKEGDFLVTGDVWVSVTDNAPNPHFGTSNLFTALPERFSHLLIVLPGEEHLPGSITGRTGLPYKQEAGREFTVDISATDRYWNAIDDVSDAIHLTTTDNDASLQEDTNLAGGKATMRVRLDTPGMQTISAFDVDDPTNITPHTGSGILVRSTVPISVENFEFDPITGPRTVSDTINVTIKATDTYGNIVETYDEPAILAVSTGDGTIQGGGEIYFSDGVWSGPVVLTKAEPNVYLSVTDFASAVTGLSDTFVVAPAGLARLQLLLPGESATPGLPLGKSGHPSAQVAGEPFTVWVRTTDAWWNLVEPGNLELDFSSTDSLAIVPEAVVQNSAQAQYEITLLFSGIDSEQVAGKSFYVRVDATDSAGNPVASYQGDIILFASTGNNTLSTTAVTLRDGFWEGDLYVTRADDNVTLYAADYVAPPYTHNGSSNSFGVVPDSFAGLQIVFPGQVATPGVMPGLSGVPVAQTAGDSFAAVIQAVDRLYNLVPENEYVITMGSTDSFAVMPDSIALTNGKSEFTLSFRSAGVHRVLASSNSNPMLPQAVSAEIEVQPNTFKQLLVRLPGENILQGDVETELQNFPGRNGTSTAQTSGIPFTIDVFAADDYFNPVPDAPADQVRLYATDNLATISPADTFLVNGHTQFIVTLSSGGNQVFQANDLSNPEIKESFEGVVNVLVGGLHYEIALDSNEVIAGQPFYLEVFYSNGIGESVAGANHLITLSAVSATNLYTVVGPLKNAVVNLQAGKRKIDQVFNVAGMIRIKVEDDIGTEPAYSELLNVKAGGISSLDISAAETEIGGLGKTDVMVTLQDQVGNPVQAKKVTFSMLSGTGSLDQTIAFSDSLGSAKVVFTGGQVTETNRIEAMADSVHAAIDIVVNLTQSDMPDGVVVNYPNPFGIETENTCIDYYLSEDADVTLKIFDLFGNLVWTKDIKAGNPGAVSRNNSAHPNSVEWTGVNDRGQKVGNGGYILLARAVANGKMIMNSKRKIVILR